MTEQQYIDYFTDLATKNKAIGHTPEQPRVYVIRDNNLDELIKATRSKLLVPALLLDQFYDDIDRTHDNPRLTITGGINVLVKCDTSNVFDVRRGREEARRLARQFLNRMFADARNPTSSLYRPGLLVATQFRGEPFEDMTGFAGWGYPIEWTLPQTVAVVADEWDDL